jgi:hypothetical protein
MSAEIKTAACTAAEAGSASMFGGAHFIGVEVCHKDIDGGAGA